MQRSSGLQKYAFVLLSLVLTVVVLHYGRSLILLLISSGLLASLLFPVARRVERVAPKWAGALVATLVMLITVIGVFFLLGWQLTRFTDDLPALKEALAVKGDAFQNWISDQFHMSQREQVAWFNTRVSEVASTSGKVALSLFGMTGSALAAIVPLPVFVFLLILLRGKFKTFFGQLGETSDGVILHIMERISKLSSKYIQGVLLVVVILGVLNSIGFLILGLKYAILMGFVVGFLNVIPYVGVMIGSLLPVVLALITKDSMAYAVGAFGVCALTQFLENNFITPKIVGSSVSINPLASIVALLAAGSLWGVMGMLLAIPITGMLKVVCDSLPSLKPYGFLLGEETEYPEEQRIKLPFTRKPSASSSKGTQA
jgi:predicted PurR-regulated permease PerM